MAEIKIIKANNVEIYPVTHEDVVVDNNGLSFGFRNQPKTDSYLSTTAKTIVGGINEINSKKVINDAQNGTAADSVKRRYLKNSGARIYPVCNSDNVTYTNGETLYTTVNSISTKNTNATSRVSRLETNISTCTSTNTTTNTKLNTVSTNIGKISDLKTSAKTNLVAAVNEIYQQTSALNTRLSSALTACNLGNICSKKFSTTLANASIEQLVQIVEDPDVGYVAPPEYSWTVEAVSGASYGFKKNTNNERWVSQNYGIDGSAAVGKIVFNNPKGRQVQLYYRCYGESSSYDYGLISNLNGTLSTSSSADSTYFAKLYSTSWTTLNLTKATSGSYYIKYRKDGSQSVDDDRLRFELKFV